MLPAKTHQEIKDLYLQHHSWIYTWLYQKLGNSCDAADLAQDTFVRLLRKQQHIELQQPRAYLTQIAKGLMFNHFRRKQLERAYLEALNAHPEYEAPSTEQQMLIIETLARVAGLLEDLPKIVQQSFLMAQIDQFKYQDIASELNISISTVKRHIQRAYAQCLLAMLDAEDL